MIISPSFSYSYDVAPPIILYYTNYKFNDNEKLMTGIYFIYPPPYIIYRSM